MSDTKTLHQILIEEFGKRTIDTTELPTAITGNLNPSFTVRPYQERTFQFFLTYWQEVFEGKPRQNHQLLFHMATGSGKTLIMAGLMQYLYAHGYRNFLFFVNSTNIIDKTRNNFLNPLSGKYLFAPQLSISDRHFAVREVANFQSSNGDDLNIVFSTIQGLHSLLNVPRENSLTYDDFQNRKIVLISDEAHHINVETLQGNQLTQEELFESRSWEGTVHRIFTANPENILLEFTATVDFSDANLSAKYKPKLIFDYTLKEFRKDLYSKEVTVLQADLAPFERALQAVLLSQYRRKIFEKNKLAIKPVILFKSKTIVESKAIFEEFKTRIASLTGKILAKVQASSKDNIFTAMFSYYDATGITLDNLAIELKADFSEDKLIVVNSKEESEAKQLDVNSLEAPNNEYRAVFAVDKLNEGWDVLNLFDIVRLYDTRDAKAGKIGKTTMSEAQLIGRGARYCPFRLTPDQPLDQRKYDQDLGNEMRICEELVYHSAHNPRYIDELKTALDIIGIKPKDTRPVTIKLKDSFKKTALYTVGHLFLNTQQKYDRSDIFGLDSTRIQKIYSFQLHSGQSQTSAVFEETNGGRVTIDRISKDYKLTDFGFPVIRKAMQRIDFYQFDNLKKHLPNLKSAQEFMASEHYLGPIKIEISGPSARVNDLTPEDKLHATAKVLLEVADGITSDRLEYTGTPEFKPYMLKDRISEEKTLNFSSDEGDKEFGKSMNDASKTAHHLDLSTRDWFVFDDCYGTSEEKLLIKFIDKHYDDLKKKFTNVYLIRNERDFKIYNFDDGRAFEPDFLLYLIGKEKRDSMYYQVFIEPKGRPWLPDDAWKEKFLISLKDKAAIDQLWKDQKYVVWGMPFFNSDQRMPEFEAAFKSLVE
ncbi:MAG: DEAD/DEAH box helicase family protein [Desulfobaccales bacterium]